jgi:hypothetical protein
MVCFDIHDLEAAMLTSSQVLAATVLNAQVRRFPLQSRRERYDGSTTGSSSPFVKQGEMASTIGSHVTKLRRRGTGRDRDLAYGRLVSILLPRHPPSACIHGELLAFAQPTLKTSANYTSYCYRHYER